MNKLKNILMISTLLGALGLTGCEKGPAEKAGQNIDKGMQKTGDALEKAADKTGDALKNAGEKVKDAVK